MKEETKKRKVDKVMLIAGIIMLVGGIASVFIWSWSFPYATVPIICGVVLTLFAVMPLSKE
jgi:polyferredoxin